MPAPITTTLMLAAFAGAVLHWPTVSAVCVVLALVNQILVALAQYGDDDGPR